MDGASRTANDCRGGFALGGRGAGCASACAGRGAGKDGQRHHPRVIGGAQGEVDFAARGGQHERLRLDGRDRNGDMGRAGPSVGRRRGRCVVFGDAVCEPTASSVTF